MIYTIKRFSGEQQPPKESHTLRNTLLGVGAVAGGVMAGRAGWLGTGVQKGIGSATARVGKWTGSKGLMRDGVKTYQKGAVTAGKKELVGGSNGAIKSIKDLSKDDIILANQSAALDTKKMMNNIGITSGDIKLTQ